MTWSAGTFGRTGGSTAWGDDRDAGTEIEAGLHDTHDQDLAQGINDCLHKGGQNAATADISMGSNKLTNLATPTADNDAANKAYVDGHVVVDYQSPVNSNISTSETLIATATVTIPSDWNTYNVEVLATFTLDFFSGVNSGVTQIDVRVRETNTSGAVVANGFDVMAESETYGLSSFGSVFGYQVGETTTGSRVMVLSAEASANASRFQMQGARFKFQCRRTS